MWVHINREHLMHVLRSSYDTTESCVVRIFVCLCMFRPWTSDLNWILGLLFEAHTKQKSNLILARNPAAHNFKCILKLPWREKWWKEVKKTKPHIAYHKWIFPLFPFNVHVQFSKRIISSVFLVSILLLYLLNHLKVRRLFFCLCVLSSIIFLSEYIFFFDFFSRFFLVVYEWFIVCYNINILIFLVFDCIFWFCKRLKLQQFKQRIKGG